MFFYSKNDFKSIIIEFTKGIDWFLVFNATFSNISTISWRPVLEKPEYQERTTDHGQTTGQLYHWGNECIFCIEYVFLFKKWL
jgi:hypothetical protein